MFEQSPTSYTCIFIVVSLGEGTFLLLKKLDELNLKIHRSQSSMKECTLKDKIHLQLFIRKLTIKKCKKIKHLFNKI